MCRVTCVGSYFGGLRHSKFFNLARQEPSHTRKREGGGGANPCEEDQLLRLV